MDERLYQHFFEIEEWFWWSVATRRAFVAALGDLPRRSRRVVDLGCGTGIMLADWPRRDALRCGCDLSSTALAFARRRGLSDLLRSDATALPFRSDAVDLVLALDVVEHLDDDAGALAEIARVLAPGGHALVHVPAYPVLWSDKDVLNHHRRRYRRRELLALVRAAGLLPAAVGYLNATLLPAALARAAWQRLVPPSADAAAESVAQLYRPPAALNRLLTAMLTAEARLWRWLPCGMSLLCLARKPTPAPPRRGAPGW